MEISSPHAPEKESIMKELLPWVLLLALALTWLLERPGEPSPVAQAGATPAEQVGAPHEPAQVFALDALRERLAASDRAYLPFLNEPTLRTGLYALPAGGEDRQEPHEKDEVYYVIQGRAQITIDGEAYDVEPGSVIFVAAHIDHRFPDIEEDLQLLVFFSEAHPSASEE